MTRGESMVLWLAQGLGTGCLRPAPGTWGSLLGVAWTLLLLLPGDPVLFCVGAVTAIALAIPACTEAERILALHDPPSVVLDEVVAMPLAFGGYVVVWAGSGAGLPTWETWRAWWPFLAAAFVLFRVLDIAKPWPIRALQALPRGWGVVMDDVVAGLGAGLLLLLGTWAAFVLRLATG